VWPSDGAPPATANIRDKPKKNFLKKIIETSLALDVDAI
jgi:hypothetical protein